jgi:hypothetical protein
VLSVVIFQSQCLAQEKSAKAGIIRYLAVSDINRRPKLK